MRVELSTIKDLPEMHRMGHTCANLNGDLFFVWGGCDDRSAHLAIRDNHLWIYETLTGYWRHRTCSGECPPYLSGTTCSLVGQRMFVFGGHSTAQDNWLNSLYSLDLDTFVWTDIGAHAQAEPTKPIPSDKCVSWSYRGRFYVFGGYGWSQTEHLLELLDRQKDLQLTPDYRWPKFGWNNQLVEFDLRDNKWRWPSYTGGCPSARAAHSGAVMGSHYYLFGGRDSRERLNDLYTFNMDTLEWSKIAVVAEPSPRLQPIRHLLEQPEVEEEREIVAVSEQMELEEEIPSASSSSSSSPASNSPIAATSNYPIPMPERDLLSSFDDSDDDDDDYSRPSQYPHPSHLLERWSLSSHPSASSTISDTVNCSEQQEIPTATLFNNQESSSRTLDLEDLEQQEDLQQADPNQMPGQEYSTATSEEPQQPTNMVPPGRSFSSFTPISSKEIMLYGGVSSEDENLTDCWIFDTTKARWRQVDFKIKQPRLWHTGSKTKNNEVVIIGGSSSDKVDEFCSDVLTIALEPRALKKLALDTVAINIRMRSVLKVKELPSTICKLIKLRKQAMALTTRRAQRSRSNNNVQPPVEN